MSETLGSQGVTQVSVTEVEMGLRYVFSNNAEPPAFVTINAYEETGGYRLTTHGPLTAEHLAIETEHLGGKELDEATSDRRNALKNEQPYDVEIDDDVWVREYPGGPAMAALRLARLVLATD